MCVVDLYMLGSLIVPIGEIFLIPSITVKYILEGFNFVVKVGICETVDILNVIMQLDGPIF